MRGVLIIDPHDDFRDFLRELFELRHWEARAVSSIGAAIAVTQEARPPDLLFIDVDSFDMSFSERALREVLPGVSYIVGMTNGFRTVQKPNAYDFVVQKPFDIDHLLTRIDRAHN